MFCAQVKRQTGRQKNKHRDRQREETNHVRGKIICNTSRQIDSDRYKDRQIGKGREKAVLDTEK